ncbi:hypothetical protein EJ065_6743 [Corallococcus coralloides]|uniref:Uncharacterized protein n=1 Tax=Corallococcus coralloides TaxID=184914 RepID=A0A410S2F7_CORCK|nr:hypothetical protein EJ065_6743 [Corallococcus coralloides]
MEGACLHVRRQGRRMQLKDGTSLQKAAHCQDARRALPPWPHEKRHAVGASVRRNDQRLDEDAAAHSLSPMSRLRSCRQEAWSRSRDAMDAAPPGPRGRKQRTHPASSGRLGQGPRAARRQSEQRLRTCAGVAPAHPPARREHPVRGRKPSAPGATSRPGRQRAHGSASAPNHHQPRQPPLRTILPTHSRNRPRAGKLDPGPGSTVEFRMEVPRRAARTTVPSSRKAVSTPARLLSTRAQNRREYVDGAPGRGVQRFASRGSHRSWKASARPS